jgi:hypothetical protein
MPRCTERVSQPREPSVGVHVRRLPPVRISHIAVAAVLATIFAIGVKPIVDPDFWWHLATGRWIIAHHAIPYHDVFSLTAQSHRWITHEWLTELLFFAAWYHGGAPLLMVATAAVITASFVLVYLAARERGAPPLLCAPLVLLAALASAHTWGTRPQMLTMLLFALYTLGLSQLVVRGRPAPPLWMPLVMVLWVNLHGGFIFGLALLGIMTVGHVLQGLWLEMQRLRATRETQTLPTLATDYVGILDASLLGRSQATVDVSRSIVIVLLTIGATLLNPNGIADALYPFSYLGNNASMRYIAEWVSPDFHQPQYLLFEAMVLLLLVGGLAGNRRARLADVLTLLPFTYLAFDSVRNISLFAVLAAPVIAELLTALLPDAWQVAHRRPVLRSRAVVNLLASIAIVLGIAIPAVLTHATLNAQARAERQTFPAGAVAYIRTHQVPSRGFDSYNWGGYLIWTLYPGRFVYVDGRPDMYGNRFMNQYIQAYEGHADWKGLFARNRLCYALVEPSSGIAQALAVTPGWHVRYHDAHSVLYVKTGWTRECPP